MKNNEELISNKFCHIVISVSATISIFASQIKEHFKYNLNFILNFNKSTFDIIPLEVNLLDDPRKAVENFCFRTREVINKSL